MAGAGRQRASDQTLSLQWRADANLHRSPGASTTPDSTTSTLTLTDHLGSHREMVTFSGGVPAITGRRDFDPYGQATQTGIVPTNAAYTSHLHERSGLELALYRAYDLELGQWLSQDPIEKEGGMNLYRYVENRPTVLVDLFGDQGAPIQGAAIVAQMTATGDIAGLLRFAETMEGTAIAVTCRVNAARLSTPAMNLIRATLKRSKSYASELETKTFAELINLAKGTGDIANKAAKMCNLIKEEIRLMDKLY